MEHDFANAFCLTKHALYTLLGHRQLPLAKVTEHWTSEHLKDVLEDLVGWICLVRIMDYLSVVAGVVMKLWISQRKEHFLSS
jgi:hypothetical protein